MLWSTSDKRVFYSRTGGNSWTASTGIPANAKIASDRVNSNNYYAFASGKIYVSTNGDASFTASTATGLPTEGNADIDAVRGQKEMFGSLEALRMEDHTAYGIPRIPAPHSPSSLMCRRQIP